MILKQVDKITAAEFIAERHYSAVMPRLTKYFLGCFEDNELIGIITFGWGTRPKHTIQALFPELDTKDYYEIGKMCMDDKMPRNSESQMLSLSFRWLKENTDIKALISYADPKEGHAGTIYQATNWLYQGNSIRPNDTYSFKLKPDDEWIHGRTLANTYRTNDIEKLKKKIGHTFWYRVEPLKHRYVYLLKNKRKLMKHLKHPIKPYPKASDVDDLEITKVVV